MQWDDEASRLYEEYIESIRDRCAADGVSDAEEVTRAEEGIWAALDQRGVETVSAHLIREILTSMEASAGSAASSTPPLPPLPPRPSASTMPPPPTFSAREAASPLAAHVPSRGTNGAPSSSMNRGCIIAIVVLFFFGGLLIAAIVGAGYYFFQSVIEEQNTACIENLTHMGAVLNENLDNQSGFYPPLASDHEAFLFGGAALEKLDVSLLRSPGAAYEGELDEDILADADYLYLGYAVRTQGEFEAYMDAYVASGGDVETFMEQEFIEGPAGDIARLRADLSDAASIPILVEWDGYHMYEGGHVLYLDGHVEFVEYDDKFPMTAAFFEEIYRGQGAKNRAECHHRLESLGAVLIAHGKQEGGVLPPLAEEHAPYLFGGQVLDELDLKLLLCPARAYGEESDEDILEDPSYFYLGYAVRSQVELEAYIEALDSVDGSVEKLMEMESIPCADGPLPRLRLDLPSPERVPLLVERTGYSHSSGGHVLYLDGHVEFLEYDERFPFTAKFFNTLSEKLDRENRVACEAQVASMGEVLAAHASRSDGVYPELGTDDQYFLFGGEALSSLDANLLRCPAAGYGEETAEEIIADADFFYLGFAVRNQEQMDTYMKAYFAADADVDVLNDSDTLSGASDDIQRLRSDLLSPESIPVLVEWPYNHEPRGGHVLYLDGHVEFLAVGDIFPMTDAFFDSFEEDWEDFSILDFFSILGEVR